MTVSERVAAGVASDEEVARRAYTLIHSGAPVETPDWAGLYEAERRHLVRFTREVIALTRAIVASK